MKNKQLKIFKLGGLVISILFIVLWLIYDPTSFKNLEGKINTALIDSSIGGLDSLSKQILEDDINLIMESSEISKYSINKPYTRGILNIYTVNEKAYGFTNCTRGNAIYNAQLDAIFLDETIINPKELPLIGENSRYSMYSLKDLPYARTYLQLILLHELGHRKLHGGSGGYFDLSSNESLSERKRELEADSFAIQSFLTTYTKAKKKGLTIYDGLPIFIGIASNSSMSATEGSSISIIATLLKISVANLFSSSDYTSYYSDKSHPTFLTRAIMLLKQIGNNAETSELVKIKTAYCLKYIERLESLTKEKFLEIHLDKAIQSLTFNDDKIIFSAGGNLYTCDLDLINSYIGQHKRSLKATFEMELEKNTVTFWSFGQLWSSGSKGNFIQKLEIPEYDSKAIGDTSIFNIDLDKKQLSLARELSSRISEKFGKTVSTNLQPSMYNVLAGPTVGRWPVKTFAVMKGNAFVGNIDTELLIAQITKKHNWANPENFELQFSSLFGKYIFFTIKKRNEIEYTLIGKVQFDLSEMQIYSVDILKLDEEVLLSDSTSTFISVPCGNLVKDILLQKHEKSWVAYSLYTNKSPEKIMEGFFLLDTMFNGNIRPSPSYSGPTFNEVKICGDGRILMSFNGESVYLLDFIKETTQIIFHPGTNIRTVISKNGFLSLYPPNSFKTYLININ